jgi:hypothetical protein
MREHRGRTDPRRAVFLLVDAESRKLRYRFARSSSSWFTRFGSALPFERS